MERDILLESIAHRLCVIADGGKANKKQGVSEADTRVCKERDKVISISQKKKCPEDSGHFFFAFSRYLVYIHRKNIQRALTVQSGFGVVKRLINADYEIRNSLVSDKMKGLSKDNVALVSDIIDAVKKHSK